MSMATWESVLDPNTKNIRKPLEGAVFVKRYDEDDEPITTVWTEAAGLTIPAEYVHVGVTSKSSTVKFGRDTDTADVESWGYAQPTRRDITKDVTTLQFTMQESKRVVFELGNSVDLSQVQADADGNIVLDKPRRPQALDWRAFVLSKDGDGPEAIYWLDLLPNCTVTGTEDQEYGEDAVLATTVTLTGFEDPVLRTAHRKIWGGPGIDVESMGFTPAP